MLLVYSVGFEAKEVRRRKQKKDMLRSIKEDKTTTVYSCVFRRGMVSFKF